MTHGSRGPDCHCRHRDAWSEMGQESLLPPASASPFRLASFPGTGSWTHRQRRSLLFLVMVGFGYDAWDDDSHFSRQLGDTVMRRMDEQRVGKYLVLHVLSPFPTFVQAFSAPGTPSRGLSLLKALPWLVARLQRSLISQQRGLWAPRAPPPNPHRRHSQNVCILS